MKVGFFEEAENVKSAGRMIFVFGSFWTMGLSTYFALTGQQPAEVLAYFSGSMVALAALKVSQKYLEQQKK